MIDTKYATYKGTEVLVKLTLPEFERPLSRKIRTLLRSRDDAAGQFR